MAKTKDLSGRKFGKLLVLKEHKSILRKDGRGSRTKWSCICECGKKTWVLRELLIEGKTKSCGCLLDDINLKNRNLTSFNDLYGTYKRHAKNRKLTFELSKEQFLILTSDNCYYCNCPPNQKAIKKRYNNGVYIYNGIDRIDNEVGYIIENCVSACGRCNFGKQTLSLEKFLEHVEKIYMNRELYNGKI